MRKFFLFVTLMLLASCSRKPIQQAENGSTIWLLPNKTTAELRTPVITSTVIDGITVEAVTYDIPVIRKELVVGYMNVTKIARMVIDGHVISLMIRHDGTILGTTEDVLNPFIMWEDIGVEKGAPLLDFVPVEETSSSLLTPITDQMVDCVRTAYGTNVANAFTQLIFFMEGERRIYLDTIGVYYGR